MSSTPVIGVIYTGGTFGMVPSAEGYVPSTDLPQRVTSEIPGLNAADMPMIKWIDHRGPPIDSSDVTPAFWYELAGTVLHHAHAYSGLVIIHGTDTLAYTGSALSFMLAELDCPVVLTGSGVPLGEPGSDAADNFCSALRVAASGHHSGVTIAFGDRLLRANRATKRHGSRNNPFASPCAEPIAELRDTIHWRFTEPFVRHPELPAFDQVIRRDARVAMLPVYPGIRGDTLRSVCAGDIGGLILEVYPSGIGPGGDADFVAAISQAVESGIVVGAVSQARHGSVYLDRYASGTPLARAGLIGGADMTREAAYAKLQYLLACNCSADQAKMLFTCNLCGELTKTD